MLCRDASLIPWLKMRIGVFALWPGEKPRDPIRLLADYIFTTIVEYAKMVHTQDNYRTGRVLPMIGCHRTTMSLNSSATAVQ